MSANSADDPTHPIEYSSGTGSGSPRKAARRCRVIWPGWPSWRRRSPPAPGMRGRRGPSLVIATNRAKYCRLCWAAAELVLTCTASRAPQDRNVTFTLFAPEPISHPRSQLGCSARMCPVRAPLSHGRLTGPAAGYWQVSAEIYLRCTCRGVARQPRSSCCRLSRRAFGLLTKPAHRRRGCSRGLSVFEVACTDFHARLHSYPGATRRAPGNELCTVVAIAQGMDHALQDPERA
jgi:hypothetical protein